jgi:hypothetical protein
MKRTQSVLVMLAVSLVVVAGCAPGTVAQINPPAPNTQAGTPAPNGQINVPGVSIQVNAPGPNPLVNTADAQGRVAGTSQGLWHGIISPVTLVLSFINKGGQIYEVHNDGSEYDLGFLVGVAIVFVILGAVVGSRRR